MINKGLVYVCLKGNNPHSVICVIYSRWHSRCQFACLPMPTMVYGPTHQSAQATFYYFTIAILSATTPLRLCASGS